MLFQVNFQYTFPAIGGVLFQEWEIIADVSRDEVADRVVEEIKIIEIHEITFGFSLGQINIEEIPDEHINAIRGYALQHGRRKFREAMRAQSGISVLDEHERASDAQTRFDRAQY